MVTTHESGLTIYRHEMPGHLVGCALIDFPAGSGSERRQESGVAHFLEHIVFKGGESYPDADAITSRAHDLGARINAYTARSSTTYYIAAPAATLADALELLTDYVARPSYGDEDVDKERGVILQEIARAHDNPAARAGSLVNGAVFGAEHVLGRPILGHTEQIERHTADTLRDFYARNYSLSGAALVLAGGIEGVSEARVDELLQRFDQSVGAAAPAVVPPPRTGLVLDSAESAQSHLCLSYGMDPLNASDRKQSAAVLGSIMLGGGMGSRLTRKLREERGLCYSIRSQVIMPYGGNPMLRIASGLRSEACAEASELIAAEVGNLREGRISDEEIEHARRYSLGNTMFAFERALTRAETGANRILQGLDDPRIERVIEATESVSCDEVREVCATIATHPAVACVGPNEPQDFEAFGVEAIEAAHQ